MRAGAHSNCADDLRELDVPPNMPQDLPCTLSLFRSRSHLLGGQPIRGAYIEVDSEVDRDVAEEGMLCDIMEEPRKLKASPLIFSGQRTYDFVPELRWKYQM